MRAEDLHLVEPAQERLRGQLLPPNAPKDSDDALGLEADLHLLAVGVPLARLNDDLAALVVARPAKLVRVGRVATPLLATLDRLHRAHEADQRRVGRERLAPGLEQRVGLVAEGRVGVLVRGCSEDGRRCGGDDRVAVVVFGCGWRKERRKGEKKRQERREECR